MTLQEAKKEFKRLYPSGDIERKAYGYKNGYKILVSFNGYLRYEYFGSIRLVLGKILKTEVKNFKK